MEIGKYAMVKDCYLKALRLSNYTDSNTIISPIINWYFWNGQKEAVVNICTEILSHNLGNCIARSYREWLITTTFSPAN